MAVKSIGVPATGTIDLPVGMEPASAAVYVSASIHTLAHGISAVLAIQIKVAGFVKFCNRIAVGNHIW